MNCPHSEDWCLECVAKLHDEKTALESQLSEQKRFIEHLEWASRVVQSWPLWKRSVLGVTDDNRTLSERIRMSHSILHEFASEVRAMEAQCDTLIAACRASRDYLRQFGDLSGMEADIRDQLTAAIADDKGES